MTKTTVPMEAARIFIACAPGLEQIAAEEVRLLGFASPAAAPRGAPPIDLHLTGGGIEAAVPASGGGSEANAFLEAVYRLNLSLRTASRVLVRLGGFSAAAFSELRKKASRLEWERFLSPEQPVALRVSCHKSRLYHSGAVTQRVLAAISDRMGRPQPSAPYVEDGDQPSAQLVVVRLLRDQVMISVDASGAHLHRRGYRLASAKAPLRETSAAAMLLASGWDATSPLLDPFCGAGTIPIEAALLANRLPPGRLRRFAFMDWPGFNHALWERLLAESDPSTGGEKSPDPAGASPNGDRTAAPQPASIIRGSDRDLGAVAMAEANAARAGVSQSVRFSCHAFSSVEPPPFPGWVVTNPPYGRRVSAQKDLRNLYARLGNLLRQKYPGWRYAVLCSEARLFSHARLGLEARLSFQNGGVAVKLYTGVIPG